MENGNIFSLYRHRIIKLINISLTNRRASDIHLIAIGLLSHFSIISWSQTHQCIRKENSSVMACQLKGMNPVYSLLSFCSVLELPLIWYQTHGPIPVCFRVSEFSITADAESAKDGKVLTKVTALLTSPSITDMQEITLQCTCCEYRNLQGL